MIKTFWTKPEISEKFAGCENLGEVIKNLETEFSDHGEVVCEIRVNGLILKEEDEKKFALSKVSEINDLMVCTNAPKTLIQQALGSVIDYLPKASKACLDCSEIYRSGEFASGQNFFHDIVEGCFWILDTVIHIRGANENSEARVALPDSWLPVEQKFSADLREVLVAMEKQDYVLIADLLEYELSGDIEGMSEVLSVFQAQGPGATA